MTHILKNKNLEIHIDDPFEGYKFSRFDWTGKIVNVIFQNIQLSAIETTTYENEAFLGKGFYNEFGIDAALGFEETKIGDWFHKIGVGLLKKDDSKYLFHKKYEIKPAKFKINKELNKIIISCKSETVNGYSYVLRKVIELHENSFTINYYLQNTGDKDIRTDEYNHNFTSINSDIIGPHYLLKFPFEIQPKHFGETVNPELKVEVGPRNIKFNNNIKEQFFFSNLTGGKIVKASWDLINLESKIGINETASFQTNKVNLWGWRHVICPELFHKIFVKPGESMTWSRNYNVYRDI